MSNSFTKRILIPILLLSLTNFGTNIFLIKHNLEQHGVKYVNMEAIVVPIYGEIVKTVEEMFAPRSQEIKVLGEQIRNLKQKKEVKGYLSTLENKELEEKTKQRTSLKASLDKEYQQQMTKMFESKIAKVNEIIGNLALKYKYTVQIIRPMQISALAALKPAIAKKDDVTELVLIELGLFAKQKA